MTYPNVVGFTLLYGVAGAIWVLVTVLPRVARRKEDLANPDKLGLMGGTFRVQWTIIGFGVVGTLVGLLAEWTHVLVGILATALIVWLAERRTSTRRS